MPANVWLLNLIVFGVLLEADLGRRKIGWFRVLRPLITTAAIIPLFLTSVPTTGHNLAVQAVGVGVGVLLGRPPTCSSRSFSTPPRAIRARLPARARAAGRSAGPASATPRSGP